MGILNVTPDSFYDGGRYLSPQQALERAERMVGEGVDIIDIGGESTRPFSTPVDEREEIRRILPVVRRLAGRLEVPLSVDTYKAGVARAALEEGVEIINDISGLTFDPAMADVAAQHDAGLILMHIRGVPGNMQENPVYDDLLAEVDRFLQASMNHAVNAGVSRERIVLDPGIGFGKGLEDNYALIRAIAYFRRHGQPVLVGPSRKSFIYKVLDCTPEDALEGTISAVIFCYLYGADIIRVHDVGPMRRALAIAGRFVGEGAG
jgi:dihydropteroate synthase